MPEFLDINPILEGGPSDDGFRFELETEDGVQHAISNNMVISVTPDDEQAKVYRRVQQKVGVTPDLETKSLLADPQDRKTWIVAELGDVRLYYCKGSIVLTKRKLA